MNEATAMFQISSREIDGHVVIFVAPPGTAVLGDNPKTIEIGRMNVNICRAMGPDAWGEHLKVIAQSLGRVAAELAGLDPSKAMVGPPTVVRGPDKN